ncbi:EAL domain-containing protein [Paucibacter sp. O1-1]|nr:EAL domain-containing protein [Paucibacter sp. O1-1]MDA3831266.1 EAL domain-containing protein [Paucibacter sp. O1-1]
MSEAQFGNDEPRRLAALAGYDLDAIAHSGLLDEIVNLAAMTCGKAAGFVNIINDELQVCLAAGGAERLSQTPRNAAFCSRTVVQDELVVVPDALLDERFKDNPFVTGNPKLRFYAGAPIRTIEGLPLGALCVTDPQPGSLDLRQRTVLDQLAALVSRIFESHRAHARAAEASVQALAESQRSYEMLARTNEAIIHARDRSELFQRVCDLAHDFELCSVAWIGWIDETAGRLRRLVPQASTGLTMQQLDRFNYAFDDQDACANSVALRAAVLGRGVVDSDYSQVAVVGGLRAEVARLGLRSTAAFPLRCGKRIVGVLTLADTTEHRFGENLLRLLQEVTDNISLFLEGQRMAEERTSAEQTLRLQREAMAASSDGIVIADAIAPDMPVVYVNAAFERMTGYAAAEALGQNCRFLQGTESAQEGVQAMRAALHERRACEVILRNYRKDGSLFWNNLRLAPVVGANGQVTHFVGSQTDVTERIRAEQELAHRATHDGLTGLPNRELLEDRLQHAIAQASRGDGRIGVAFVDLDNFKMFNDSIGHTAGDTVLKTVGDRLRTCLRSGDTVARLGGDEFVIVIEQLDDDAMLHDVGQRVLSAVAQPITLDGQAYEVGCSVGLAVYPRDGATPGSLIQHADFAMYKAKEDGRGVLRIYEPKFDARHADRLNLEVALRQALTRKEFVLFYQPKCDTASGRICGAEALVRWHHPERGLVPPLQFIELAEQTGVIVPLGEWVLEEACRENQRLREAGLSDFAIAVNVSAIQFKHANFMDMIRRALAETGLSPAGLSLEITESVMMSDPETFTTTLRDLRALGVKVALDDFGTGYSSLSYLKRFPIDQVKIDRAFVRDITSDAADAAICSAIIAMAHSLGMGVVAEGVENSEQVAFLRGRGCDELQGYYLSKPLAAPAFQQWLSTPQAQLGMSL